MDPELAIQALGMVAAGPDATVMVADIDWSHFAARPTPLLSHLIPSAGAAAPEILPGQADDLAARLKDLTPPQQERLLIDLVCRQAASVLGHGAAHMVEETRAFSDLGFDSLTAVEFRNSLSVATGLRLSPTAVFDFPTPVALSGHLLAELTVTEEPGQPPVLDGLDQLEAAILEISPDDGLRAAVRTRLHVMLSKLDKPGSDEADSASTRLESATDDEIFQFIHEELGRS
ncbi:phosphopantetheine-binding protein [Streptacidiphilus sp. EB129]|uniref:phosphopantetheine-binding protein n=1 Tax=Streptacidiphilus sp. EB129 TaxID=3156262 RepID=UPI00351972AA